MIYIILQSTYDGVEALLKNNDKVEMVAIPKVEATKQLIPSLEVLLHKQGLTIDKIDFIGINQGPAPFTTLRVLIATVNGISFASKVPLIGIDGLKAFVEENISTQITIVLLNAFANDIYFGISDKQEIFTGCSNIYKFLTDLKNKYLSNELYFMGNAIDVYKNEIRELFPAAKLAVTKQFVSIEQVAKLAEQKFKQGELSKKLLPIYLKNPHF